MSDAVTLRSEPHRPVDEALGAWRDETERRRRAYQRRAAAHNAEQARRRGRLYRIAAAGAALGMATMAVLVSTLAPAPPTMMETPVAPSSAPPLPLLAPAIRAPVRSIVPDGPVVQDVRSWSLDGELWIQFDYRGSPLDLVWRDGAGAPVLERVRCTNRLPDGRSRCYVGRTASRIDAALAAGAAPGRWTVLACRGDACTDVAAYEVPPRG